MEHQLKLEGIEEFKHQSIIANITFGKSLSIETEIDYDGEISSTFTVKNRPSTHNPKRYKSLREAIIAYNDIS